MLGGVRALWSSYVPTSYVTLGLNFLIYKMGIVTISTSRGVVRTKWKAPGVVPGVG